MQKNLILSKFVFEKTNFPAANDFFVLYIMKTSHYVSLGTRIKMAIKEMFYREHVRYDTNSLVSLAWLQCGFLKLTKKLRYVLD